MTKTFDVLVSKEVIEQTKASLTEKGFLPIFVETGEEALAKIKELIPAGVSVMNGSSRTLEEIGFVDYLKGDTHGWNNLHQNILEEKDPTKQAVLRKHAVLSDYFLNSAHALTQNGELVIASASGSQLPHLTFTSGNIIFVIGAQKIIANLDEALVRINDYVFPLENARMKEVGMGGSNLSKILILKNEPAFMGRKVHVILVNEKLGF
ncbi:MAG: lactate utilization protein [Candidatus Paceibacterota bacterium]|jgi:hypothetical protein